MDSLPEPMFEPIPSDWPDRKWSEFHVVQGITWHIQRYGADRPQRPPVPLAHCTGGRTHSTAGIPPARAPTPCIHTPRPPP